MRDDPRRKVILEDIPTYQGIWILKERMQVLGAFAHHKVRGEPNQWLAELQGPSVYKEEIYAVNVLHVT